MDNELEEEPIHTPAQRRVAVLGAMRMALLSHVAALAFMARDDDANLTRISLSYDVMGGDVSASYKLPKYGYFDLKDATQLAKVNSIKLQARAKYVSGYKNKKSSKKARNNYKGR